MPLDPDPVPGGNVWLLADGTAEIHAVGDPTAIRHVSHFATCPNANQHRRTR